MTSAERLLDLMKGCAPPNQYIVALEMGFGVNGENWGSVPPRKLATRMGQLQSLALVKLETS